MKAKQLRDSKLIRQYLLGELNDEQTRREIETMLLTDDDFAEEIAICEDELIDGYVVGRLSAVERDKFENYFLISPDRRQKLEFARGFKSHLEEHLPVGERATETTKSKEKNAGGKTFFQWLWANSAARATALAAALLLVAGAGVWYAFLRQTDVDKGLLALEQRYQAQRPLEARLADLNYAPFASTRGADGNDDSAEQNRALAQRRAERLLQDALESRPDARAYNALGKFYLLEKNFEQAVSLFEQAVKLAPGNAPMHSDLGAARLEIGKRAALGGDRAKSLESLAKSLEHLEKAVALNPRLLEARFNRALCLQALFLTEQTKAAWQEYLRLDSGSPWAEEARQNLARLEDQKTQTKNGAEILDDFIEAVRRGDENAAWQIQSRNKEMIHGKLIPQSLARLFLIAATDKRETEAQEFLRLLIRSSDLEKQRAQDPYFADVANYYRTIGKDKYSVLLQAQESVTAGYELCLQAKYGEARASFASARQSFEQAGNLFERLLAEYWIAYCDFNLSRINESLVLLDRLAAECRARSYKWLTVHALNLLAQNHSVLNNHSQSLVYNRQALGLAEEIADAYAAQRVVSRIANTLRILGQSEAAMGYAQKLLEINRFPETSERQKWRDYAVIVELLFVLKLYRAAAAFAEEFLLLAAKLKDATFAHFANSSIALIYDALGEREKSMEFSIAGRRVAGALADESTRSKAIALSNLWLADSQRKARNCREALENYDRSVATYDSLEFKLNEYAARKGRLLCYIENKDEPKIQAELPIVVELFEQYRTKIVEEQNRNSFFDNEQDVYDIAVDYERGKGDFIEAFALAESSRSRSLLDRLTSATGATGATRAAETLTLAELQAQMPEQTQIVQYAVLDDKVLAWIISKTGFQTIEKSISAVELEGKVAVYLELLTSGEDDKRREAESVARELYDVLIAPIANQLDENKVICFVPDKFLFRLPFAALRTAATGRFLLEDHSLIYAPSAAVFVEASNRAAQKLLPERETLLSVGNPTLERGEFENLPDLPAAEREAVKIGEFYAPATVLTGAAALKNAVVPAMKTANVIHYAGHYVTDKSSAARSRLLLADAKRGGQENYLTGAELSEQLLPETRLIVLSACETGVERFYRGEGMIGISRDFLAAGVPLVVASRWKVDSDATFELMLRFHRYRKQYNVSTVTALRQAQIDLLNSPNEKLRSPYYWAAFAPFGGHANFNPNALQKGEQQ